MRSDPEITDFDLNAYVDGQLSFARRLEVERFLAADQEAARRVMADISARNDLRLALPLPTDEPAPKTMAYARRLQMNAVGARVARNLLRAAAAIILVLAGWLARGEMTASDVASGLTKAVAPPVLISDAVRSYHAALLRSEMHFAPTLKTVDRKDIESATHIALPDLPDSWEVKDIEVFPSDEGPSLELTLDAQDLGTVSLFAVRASDDAQIAPTAAHDGTDAIAYWQNGQVAYALVSAGEREGLLKAAQSMSADKNKN